MYCSLTWLPYIQQECASYTPELPLWLRSAHLDDLEWFPTGIKIDGGTGSYSLLLFIKTKHKLLFDWIWKNWISADFSHGLKSSCNWIWPENTCSSFTDLHCGGFLRNCLENFQFLMHPCDNLQLDNPSNTGLYKRLSELTPVSCFQKQAVTNI